MLLGGEVHGVGEVIGHVELHVREGCHGYSSCN